MKFLDYYKIKYSVTSHKQQRCFESDFFTSSGRFRHFSILRHDSDTDMPKYNERVETKLYDPYVKHFPTVLACSMPYRFTRIRHSTLTRQTAGPIGCAVSYVMHL